MKTIIILCIMFCLVLSGCGNSVKVKFPSTQEYIAGQGNIKGDVNIAYYSSIDEAFEIGANANGYAVFKNPDKAFNMLVEKYSDGINLIKQSFDLSTLTPKNYKEYKTYGWQTTTGTTEEQEQTDFVSMFFDIYENSFK